MKQRILLATSLKEFSPMSTDQDVELASAIDAHARGERHVARDALRRLLQEHPAFAEAWHWLGALAFEDGDTQGAFSFLRMAVELNGGEPRFLNLLAIVQRDLGRLSDAEATLRRLLNIEPTHELGLRNLGLVLVDRLQMEEAIEVLQRALQLGHEHYITWNLLGIAHDQRGRWLEAEAAYLRACELNPADANASTNLGALLARTGRADEALQYARRAVELQPSFYKAWSNLGLALNNARRWDEAIACHLRATELNPKLAGAWNNLGTAYKEVGRIAEAVTAYRRAFALEPRPATLSNLLLTLVYEPTISPEQLAAEHRVWGEMFDRFPASPPHASERDTNRRLRIGYVSPDFRAHAVARFIEPLLTHHDQQRFDVFCYSNVPVPDETTKRLQQLVGENWRAIYGVSDDAVAAQIRADRIDILIDLAGHTALNRLLVFARRPAPLQATYLGYPATTGLRAIQFRFTDAVQDPPGEPDFGVETLVRLPVGSSCFQPPAATPDIAMSPAARNGFVTFGSPHNLAKLNDVVFDTWSRILLALPTSRLLLFRGSLSSDAANQLRAALARRGVAPSRLDIRNVSSGTHGYDGYLATYHDIDICLDAFPANAGTTACEALWMGVPWVTVLGDRFYSRQTASVLARVGLSDWIATSRDEYAALAVKKTSDLESLVGLRVNLRTRFLESPIGNPAKYTLGFEQTLRELWGDRVRSK